jgi:hypothetical protein
VSPRGARFLTRLYPATWRARYAAEFQTFLQSRHISALEALSIAGFALAERTREKWQTEKPVIPFVSVVAVTSSVSYYLGLSQARHPALWFCWAAAVLTAAAVTNPVIRLPEQNIRSVIRAPRSLIAGAAFFFSVVWVLLFAAPWSMPVATIVMWCSVITEGLACRPSSTISPQRSALIASAMLLSLGWGLLYRGSLSIVDHPLLSLTFPLLAIADKISTARRLVTRSQ